MGSRRVKTENRYEGGRREALSQTSSWGTQSQNLMLADIDRRDTRLLRYETEYYERRQMIIILWLVIMVKKREHIIISLQEIPARQQQRQVCTPPLPRSLSPIFAEPHIFWKPFLFSISWFFQALAVFVLRSCDPVHLGIGSTVPAPRQVYERRILEVLRCFLARIFREGVLFAIEFDRMGGNNLPCLWWTAPRRRGIVASK